MQGAYTTERAAALAGVPKSTLEYWKRTSLLVPSVSAERVVLWSYDDLLKLRIVEWLRQPKGVIAATPMQQIREAIAKLDADGLDRWHTGDTALRVSGDGRLHIVGPEGLQTPRGQLADETLLVPIAPFRLASLSTVGPDLDRPRPSLRIRPGKLSGSPHVDGTRIETCVLRALHDRGMSTPRIRSLYPYLSDDQVDEALDLEAQLSANQAAA